MPNGMEPESRVGRTGRLAKRLMRLDFFILDELGHRPFPLIRRADPSPGKQSPDCFSSLFRSSDQ
jgi:hypothetical protein